MTTPTSSYSPTIEFCGGPLDGRIDQCAPPLRPFVACVLRGARRRSLWKRLLSLFNRVEAMPVRSAIYVLDDDCHRYRFLRTQFIAEQCARGEAVRLIEAKC